MSLPRSRKYGYPPDKQETATRTVIEQACLKSLASLKAASMIGCLF